MRLLGIVFVLLGSKMLFDLLMSCRTKVTSFEQARKLAWRVVFSKMLPQLVKSGKGLRSTIASVDRAIHVTTVVNILEVTAKLVFSWEGQLAAWMSATESWFCKHFRRLGSDQCSRAVLSFRIDSFQTQYAYINW